MPGAVLSLPDVLLASRLGLPRPPAAARAEAEGGCGVIGLLSTEPVAGRHLVSSCARMRNRGNGKGGGVAVGGLDAAQLGVSEDILREDYLLLVAYLEPASRAAVEAEFVDAVFDVRARAGFPSLESTAQVHGLEAKPPEVHRYFVRAKPKILDAFIASRARRAPEDPETASREDARRRWEDEFVFQNSYRLNARHYAWLGTKNAFVLSHAKDLMVLKLVGYAEDALRWYRLEDLKAKLWIGHQRYPTKGRVWHPGGAHPFIGMHEALVHNGDFANYSRVARYLRQRGVHQQFLTDTEVSVQLFDLWTRVYGYSLEHAIEAMAPTTERDFDLLPAHRRTAYRALQTSTIKGSPDGPWFFILARHDPAARELQLVGITDASMLRPQVFALQTRGEASIGLIASEKQAIDCALAGLAGSGSPFSATADRYWNARGGSYSDGGAFAFRLTAKGKFLVTDKFGNPVTAKGRDPKQDLCRVRTEADLEGDAGIERRVTAADGGPILPPKGPGSLLAVDASGFDIEGPRGASAFIVAAHKAGWRKFMVYRLAGHRFLGCGLGPKADCEIDCHGSPGDYLGSGLDGVVLHVYNDAQDQVGQILKDGKLVIYGDVGQTFLYGAKGGTAYVLGNAAGRPLINAVGSVRVVINGTCLDYLGESFMAGDPHRGGGFAIVNGVRYTGPGAFQELDTPYPGANLFSLASGGAVFLRDPFRRVTEDQLNGGKFEEVTTRDWDLIRPYLDENERLFGVTVSSLLRCGEKFLTAGEAYVKVVPMRLRALTVAHD